MEDTMKQNKTRIKELRQELHHWQMNARIELRWYRMSTGKCREIAAQMRKLQAGYPNAADGGTGIKGDASVKEQRT